MAWKSKKQCQRKYFWRNSFRYWMRESLSLDTDVNINRKQRTEINYLIWYKFDYKVFTRFWVKNVHWHWKFIHFCITFWNMHVFLCTNLSFHKSSPFLQIKTVSNRSLRPQNIYRWMTLWGESWLSAFHSIEKIDFYSEAVKFLLAFRVLLIEMLIFEEKKESKGDLI